VQPDRPPTQEVQLIDRVVIYDTETGAIVGSHTFAASGPVSEGARERFEALLERQVADLGKRHNRTFAVKRSAELLKLTTLAHRVDLASGGLVEQAASENPADSGTAPRRITIQ
jgi:hypothetical protein